MSFGSRRARAESKFEFDSRGIDTYYSLKDLYTVVGDKPQVIRKLWINTASRYGANPMVTTRTCHVNLPSYLLSEVQEMMSNDEDVRDINAGKAAFRIVKKVRKGTKDTYMGIEWCDPDPEDLPF